MTTTKQRSTHVRPTNGSDRGNHANLRVFGVGSLITAVLLGIAAGAVYLSWVHEILTLKVLGIVAAMMYALVVVLWFWRKTRGRTGPQPPD